MTPKPEEQIRKELEHVGNRGGDAVVVSGMSGLYPMSDHVKDFSEILYKKVNPITKKNERWKSNHPEVSQYTGTIPALDRFDAQFFKVHFRLGNSMDSMSRKILEQTYQALYDAGRSPDQLNGKKIAVFIGACFSETEKASFYVASTRTGFGIVGCNKSMFSNRISYWLNVKGPSMAIDEACCSSSGALTQAYLALTRGDCEAAIVGGANLFLHPQSSIHTGRIVPNCPDGKTKSFDENADGCAKSEAIQVVFLEKAKNALRVYAEIVNVKNEFIGITSTDSSPQYGFYRSPAVMTNFLNKFYKDVNISPELVEYIEATGAAIRDADKAELDTIGEVFCKNRIKPLLVGSVYSNIGYTEASSGLCSLIKVLLGYHTGKLAANLHFSNPRKDVPALHDGRIRIVTESEPFSRSYTAITNHSITGCTAHILLNGQYKPKDNTRYKSTIPRLVTISARQESAVLRILDDLKSRPVDPEELALLHNIHSYNISGHLGRGFIILDTNAEQETVSLIEKCEYFDDARRPLWFVYSGMGSQWAGMGAHLMRIPIFAAAIERCQRALKPKGIDLIHIVTSTDKAIFDNILHSFVGIAAVQIGLTDVLKELGLVPDKIIGHSVGELGCAYADGCFTAEEMILSAYSRGLVSIQTPFIRGSMAAVGIGYEKIKEMIPPEIEVACHNSAESSTISGPADVMREFVATLTTSGVFAKEVPCSNIAYHSRYIAEAGPALRKYLSEVIKDPKERSDRWVSTSVPRNRWDQPSAKFSSAEYHTNNLLNPVLFEETSSLIPANAVLVEVAPHGLLQAILKRSLAQSCKHIPLTRRGHPDNALMVLEGIGKLFMEGYTPKINVLYPKVEFPVSTGTPMLSHLVEWAHNEKWALPLYVAAHRKTAAAAKYVISLYDHENSYLRGHVIRGKNVYPFSSALIAVWDTLAMWLDKPKNEISATFDDVQFFAQPIINDQTQLKICVALHRGTGRFEVMENNSKVATGYIREGLVENTIGIEEANENLILNDKDVYQILHEREYSYGGEFRSIQKANVLFTEAQILWENNWVTLVDGMLQVNALRQKHDGVSQPSNIRRITINTKLHMETEKIEMNGKSVLKANVNELFDQTRCGGVIMETIKFENLLNSNSKRAVLKTLKFVPHFNLSPSDVKTSVQVFLQMVAENVNKTVLNVVEILNSSDKHTIFNAAENVNGIPSLKVLLKQIPIEAVSQSEELLTNVDLVLVRNLSIEDIICKQLYSALNSNVFILSAEDTSHDSIRVRPSSLYRVVASQNSGEAWLYLGKWRPTALTTSTTALTVRTESDLGMLTATRDCLPANHKLLVLTSYHPVEGVKDLVDIWRKDSERNQVYLVMVNHDTAKDESLVELPELDLAVNVLTQGIWGGEYYLPLKNKQLGAPLVTLQSKQIGDLNSLNWVQAEEPTNAGIAVTVHYAGLNTVDSKRASGVYPFKKDNGFDNNCYGMDFSGVTDSGVQVMGLVRSGAASSRLKVAPELLWPVPSHWTMEDAATVPMPYAQAFYCLFIKAYMLSNRSILVHGGAGALGQAAISIALAHGLLVFTTVSDLRKKHFLRKLFPELKEEHIGNSRDCCGSFRDMVLANTNGLGVNYVLNCVTAELKDMSFKCVSSKGATIDTIEIQSHEKYNFGLSNLTMERCYIRTDFSAIFDHKIDMLRLQYMISEGISRGYVRPLSRVKYEPSEVPRAIRLLDTSQHRGRVLIKLCDNTPLVQPRLACTQSQTQVVVCDDPSLGTQVADRLVKSGARKVLLHLANVPAHVIYKKKSWEKLGVEVKVSTDQLDTEKEVVTLLMSATKMGAIEGIYFVSTAFNSKSKQQVLKDLDSASKKLCPSIKFFTVVSTDYGLGNKTCVSRALKKLPATKVYLPSVQKVGDAEKAATDALSVRLACDAVESALCSRQLNTIAQVENVNRNSLLEQIAAVADIQLPDKIDDSSRLKDFGLTVEKIEGVAILLRDEYCQSLTTESILGLTVQDLRKMEEILNGVEFEETSGLGVFFSHFDSDELSSTTEIILLPTLANDTMMREDEFDMTQTYLCILPGLEGHFERFRGVCERLKLPALVVQPGLDMPNESIKQMAVRYAQVLLKKISIKNNFYLLGYESGVLVALETAAILEEHGLTGTVYCIGTAPEQFLKIVEKEIGNYSNDKELQRAVLRHMYKLVSGEELTLNLDASLQWKDHIELCVRDLLGRVPLSAQYARAIFETPYYRVKQVLQYKSQLKPLQSKLVFLQPDDAKDLAVAVTLQKFSKQPVATHCLKLPLAHVLQDLRCAAYVNEYLDDDVIEVFNKKNLCETYLLSSDTFVTASSPVSVE